MKSKQVAPFEVDIRKTADVVAEFRKKRAAEMLRLKSEYKWTYERIASLYGVKRQYVGQLVKYARSRLPA